MQRSVSRTVHNVYIAMSFTDETLDNTEMTHAAEVSGGVHDTTISVNNVYLYIKLFLQSKPRHPC